MERSTEIEALVEDWFHAMGKGDLAAVDALIGTGDVRFIGTDAGEWWGPDRADVSRLMTTQIQEGLGQVAYDVSDLEGYREGTVGWAAGKVHITLPDASSIDCRLTAVLRQETDGWRCAQAHMSLGAANEDTFGQEFTTT